MKTEHYQDVINHAINKLESFDSIDYASDLHHFLFNEDYFIIGTYKAKQWLGESITKVIEKIREYEQDNFGTVSTEFSNPENVANMYAYILGEEVLSKSETLYGKWDSSLDKEDIENIIAEIDAIPLRSI